VQFCLFDAQPPTGWTNCRVVHAPRAPAPNP